MIPDVQVTYLYIPTLNISIFTVLFVFQLSTSSSCLFLISKVFVFDVSLHTVFVLCNSFIDCPFKKCICLFQWVNSSQKIFEVILIVTSFVLAWGEAWFLDCRVIPQERHARRYLSCRLIHIIHRYLFTDHNYVQLHQLFLASSTQQQSSFPAPLLTVPSQRRLPDSASNFYSPLDSAHNSDAEEELVQRISLQRIR